MTYQNAEPDLQEQGAPTRWGEYREWSDSIPRELGPDAKGLFLPSTEVIELAGRPRGKRPCGWAKPPSGTSRVIYGKRYAGSRMKILAGRYCTVKRYGEWWTIERTPLSIYEVMVFSLGPLLVVTRDRKAAIQLAGCCSPHAPDNLGLFSWMEV